MENFKRMKLYLVALGFISIFLSCGNQQSKEEIGQNSDSTLFLVQHPDWVKNANIYEVNLRQYTKSGTIKEFETHLPRLKEMGVDILWLMPVFPIGQKNRKATQNLLAEEIKNPKERDKYLGSYYAIKDYMKVNPEFGTLEELQALVDKIHEMGMHVILDIAINHTAWDHPWVQSHPEYYTRIAKDSIPWNKEWMKQHPAYYKQLMELGMTYPIDGNGETDWWDTADLNYDNDSLRSEMTKIFKFWIEKVDVDGYRCDVADKVPTDFWDSLRPELDKTKPVFMLAEAEKEFLHYQSFDASYAWEFHHIMNKIAQGKEKVEAIDNYYKKDTIYDLNAIRMNFTTNHDENSWNGTIQERLGDASKTMAVLYYTIPGMPLIYSGQEAGLNKRLKFFEKDQIDWDKDKSLAEFYKSLNELKSKNMALWNGNAGSPLERLKTSNDSLIFAFTREKEDNKVLCIFNLSNEAVKFSIDSDKDFKGMNAYFTASQFENKELELKPWEYLVFVK